jgi:hypothetical protein
MGDGFHLLARAPQQVARGPVEHHGVAACNALHQRVSEVRGALEQGRIADVLVACVDQQRARTIEGRHVLGHGLEPVHRALELVGLPDVVLVSVGEVVGFDVGATGQGQEIGRRSFGRPCMDGQAVLSPMRLVVLEDGVRMVVGAVVRSPDGPCRVRLGRNRVELLGQEVLPLHRAHQHRNLGHRRMWPEQQGLQGHQRDDPAELLPRRQQLIDRCLARTVAPLQRGLCGCFSCLIHGGADSSQRFFTALGKPRGVDRSPCLLHGGAGRFLLRFPSASVVFPHRRTRRRLLQGDNRATRRAGGFGPEPTPWRRWPRAAQGGGSPIRDNPRVTELAEAAATAAPPAPPRAVRHLAVGPPAAARSR